MFSNRYETPSVWQAQGRGCKLKHLYQKDWREKKAPPDYGSRQNGGEFRWLWAERRQVMNRWGFPTTCACSCFPFHHRAGCVCVYTCAHTCVYVLCVCVCLSVHVVLVWGNLGFTLQTNHPQSQPVPSDLHGHFRNWTEAHEHRGKCSSLPLRLARSGSHNSWRATVVTRSKFLTSQIKPHSFKASSFIFVSGKAYNPAAGS